MNKSALQDIQQALNAIRSEIERVDDETKWAALELMLGTSRSVVAFAKKMAKSKESSIILEHPDRSRHRHRSKRR